MRIKRKTDNPAQRKGGYHMPHHLMQHFTYHPMVNSELDETHRIYYETASTIDNLLDETAEKTVALRKLLESRDAAIRAALMDLNNAQRDQALKDVAKNLYPQHTVENTPDV